MTFQSFPVGFCGIPIPSAELRPRRHLCRGFSHLLLSVVATRLSHAGELEWSTEVWTRSGSVTHEFCVSWVMRCSPIFELRCVLCKVISTGHVADRVSYARCSLKRSTFFFVLRFLLSTLIFFKFPEIILEDTHFSRWQISSDENSVSIDSSSWPSSESLVVCNQQQHRSAQRHRSSNAEHRDECSKCNLTVQRKRSDSEELGSLRGQVFRLAPDRCL